MESPKKVSRDSSPGSRSDHNVRNPTQIEPESEKTELPTVPTVEAAVVSTYGPPPDGGFQAWLVVLGGFCTVFASFGWINCKLQYPQQNTVNMWQALASFKTITKPTNSRHTQPAQ
jgi:hypothetical protein